MAQACDLNFYAKGQAGLDLDQLSVESPEQAQSACQGGVIYSGAFR